MPYYFTGSVGHGAFNHDPDQTYNVRGFQNNEMRTMRMAQEVYKQIQLFTDDTASLSWNQIKGTVSEFIVAGKAEGNAEPRWQDKCVGIISIFCDAEQAQIRRTAEISKKLDILGSRLISLGLVNTNEFIPKKGKLSYDKDDASARRIANLSGLTHKINIETGLRKFNGVLLPSD